MDSLSYLRTVKKDDQGKNLLNGLNMVLLYQEKTKGGSERAHNGPKRVDKLFSGKIVIFVPKMFGLGSSPPPPPTLMLTKSVVVVFDGCLN